MDGYKSLPFASYDLAVYLPGGAVFIVVLRAISVAIFGYDPFQLIALSDGNSIDIAIKAVAWLSLSYLAGHLAAFVSTYTVERFVHEVVGFPSDIWFEKELKVRGGVEARTALRSIFDNKISAYKHRLRFSSVIVLFFQAPLILYLVIFWIFRPLGFYYPKTPDGIISDVEECYRKIRSSVQFDISTRWDKMVEHFVSNNCPSAYTRMYNYLVIYGALRLLSFIILFILWAVIMYDVKYRLDTGNWFTVDFWKTFQFQIAAGANFLSMMAFAKFNRRYFEESLYALLLAPTSVAHAPK